MNPAAPPFAALVFFIVAVLCAVGGITLRRTELSLAGVTFAVLDAAWVIVAAIERWAG